MLCVEIIEKVVKNWLYKKRYDSNAFLKIAIKVWYDISEAGSYVVWNFQALIF